MRTERRAGLNRLVLLLLLTLTLTRIKHLSRDYLILIFMYLVRQYSVHGVVF